MRVALQAAYLLHQQPFRDHSVLVEVWTADYGRLGLLARGVQRPRSPLRGLLQQFRPLLLSWSGRGELCTLTAVEPDGAPHLLTGSALLSGLYLNELLLRLAPREESHSCLFKEYARALGGLAQVANVEEQARGAVEQSLLRRFECRLLEEMGYGLLLDREADTGAPISEEGYYLYDFARGPIRAAVRPPSGGSLAVQGHSLLALARGELLDVQALRDAKHLLRAAIDHHMSGRALQSRRLRQAYERMRARPEVDADASPSTHATQVET